MKIIQSDKIPTPKGHYSPAIEHNGMLYLSGQLPVNPENGTIPDGIEAQMFQVFKNIINILNESGSSKDKILQVRLYIPDIEMWNIINNVYIEIMGNHKPVRTVIPTRDLHYGALIEVEITAIL